MWFYKSFSPSPHLLPSSRLLLQLGGSQNGQKEYQQIEWCIEKRNWQPPPWLHLKPGRSSWDPKMTLTSQGSSEKGMPHYDPTTSAASQCVPSLFKLLAKYKPLPESMGTKWSETWMEHTTKRSIKTNKTVQTGHVFIYIYIYNIFYCISNIFSLYQYANYTYIIRHALSLQIYAYKLHIYAKCAYIMWYVLSPYCMLHMPGPAPSDQV